jgi:hypothetical protein
MYDWEVMARSRVLHKELLDLVAADQKHRTRNSHVVWSDLKQHQDRLARVNEIKEELAKLAHRRPVLKSTSSRAGGP